MTGGLMLSALVMLTSSDLLFSSLGLSLLCLMWLMTMVLLNPETEFEGLFYTDIIMQIMVLLTLFIGSLACLSSVKSARKQSLSVVSMMVVFILTLSFGVSSFLLFFFFFESVLCPLLILIVGWGYQPERLQAGVYMMIYTVFGSLFFLWGMVNLFLSGFSMSMSSLVSSVNKCCVNLWWLYMLGFFIKLPMYPFHLWLPKAHVEAPVIGSMLLAGVVLKLGGYGVLRFMSILDISLSSGAALMIMVVVLLGGLYAGLVCVRQSDLKCLVAYSSVSHMSLVLVGILSNCTLGVMGSVLIMVGHGLCSSGLFSLTNVLFKMSQSRLLVMNKGMIVINPGIAVICFLLSSSNMAAPPSLNLFGEVLMFMVSMMMSGGFLCIMMSLSFVSGCFSLYLYSSCSHGKSPEYINSIVNASFCDSSVLWAHWIPLNVLFLFVV
uniref:NADH-ubiquinone oxidoreductase chain 4 n=1 Tax=Mytilus californianus TaxID=6549 RepID=J9S1C2_MYTCA|nr:NADH dehydrogenase subunit 4 [Mytilus californianus]